MRPTPSNGIGLGVEDGVVGVTPFPPFPLFPPFPPLVPLLLMETEPDFEKLAQVMRVLFAKWMTIDRLPKKAPMPSCVDE